MRMRKKKNGPARLAAVSHLFCEKPNTPIATPAEDFGREGPLWLEVGCGKGGFACGMAKKHPDANIYAMERITDVVMLAAERAEREKDERPDNLRFILGGAAELPEFFAPLSFDRVYLNFSDPWPKKGYAKRRLTYRGFLRVYFSLLKMGGELRFKTDNIGLFDFTLEELAVVGLTPHFVTRDLHREPVVADNVMTEYERNFSEKGTPICSLWVCKERELPPEEIERKEEEKA
ncbi:MAG: tRNA (guanosine(46)-N7)-methyltransferase TrmB [Clostridia bacterium]|nr:tRNA (guanosine(46)-N7)-methyltransferase TrmB [Clostridia bacterium]